MKTKRGEKVDWPKVAKQNTSIRGQVRSHISYSLLAVRIGITIWA